MSQVDLDKTILPFIYDNTYNHFFFQDTSNINCLIQLLCGTHVESECAANILARCCQVFVLLYVLSNTMLLSTF